MRLKKFVIILFLLISVSSVAFADEYYDVAPKFTAPYSAGKLKASLLDEALAELNSIRKIVGVPYNVKLSDEYNNKAQHGAVLLDVINTLTHYPSQPSDMDSSFYNLAYDATTHGNISMGWNSAGVGMDLIQAIYGCMDDSDSSNISALGHRRWLLNPRMKQVGFGLSVKSGSGADYAVTYVIEEVTDYDETKKWPISDEFIAWPSSKNPTPKEYFNSERNEVAWSVTPNPEIFSVGYPTITLTRISDSKTWTFSSSSSQGYYTVNTDTYGWDPCIIFRPDEISSYNDGDKFHVEITGLTRKDGAAGTIKYDVTFGTASSEAKSTDDTDESDIVSSDPEDETTDTDTNKSVEAKTEVKNDPESLLPINGEKTMNNLAKALKMDVDDINFVTTVDSTDITSSDAAIEFAKSEGFKITTNFSSITAKTGYNAFKIYVNVAGISGKSSADIKIYVARKTTVDSSITPATTGEVIESELFDANGNKFDTVPDPILVAVDISEAGEYSVHLAEKNTSKSTTTTSPTSGDKAAGEDSSGGCDSGYGVFALVTLLTFGIPRVKARWNK